jgi:hypothetical protein
VRRLMGASCAVLFFGLFTASQAAALHFPNQPTFKLRGSNGYTITGGGDRYGSTLTASKGPGSASYGAPRGGTATAKRMQLDLGTAGGFDVSFHAKRTRMVSPPKGCKGKDAPKKIGLWKGPIEFNGEGGYTSVHAHKAKGSVLFSKRWNCRGYVARRGTQLFAVGGQLPSAPIQFTAFRPAGTTKSEFKATASGSFEAGSTKVSFLRSVALTGPMSTFTFNGDLTSAHVDPPGPFSGSAHYAKPNGWSGSLEVNFPGQRHVKLASPEFGATLGRGKF